MFQSGQWQGYWEQAGFGRQFMSNFSLRFSNGEITGEGRDIIGPFIFHGNYTEMGIVTMVKQYLHRHQVCYTGSYYGEGTIFGQWNVSGFNSGPFAMQPVKSSGTADLPIQDL